MKNLRNIVAVLIISLLSINSFGQSDVSGEWIVDEDNTLIKIEQDMGIYSGKIISSDNPKAPIGELIVKEVKQTKGKLEGKVFSLKRQEWYDAEFIPKENQLDVEISVGFYKKTIEWTKA